MTIDEFNDQSWFVGSTNGEDKYQLLEATCFLFAISVENFYRKVPGFFLMNLKYSHKCCG